MTSPVQIHLFGSLQKKRSFQGSGSFVEIEVDTPIPLTSLLEMGHIPSNRVQLVMVNHRAVSKGVTIHPGDRVALFPAEYAFFADWKDFRS